MALFNIEDSELRTYRENLILKLEELKEKKNGSAEIDLYKSLFSADLTMY